MKLLPRWTYGSPAGIPDDFTAVRSQSAQRDHGRDEPVGGARDNLSAAITRRLHEIHL